MRITSTALAAAVALSLAGCTLGPVALPSKTPKPPVSVQGEGSGTSDFGSGPCDDRDIVVDQEGSQLVLSGHCASVTISAANVAVNLESSDVVTVSGTEVTVLAETVGSATLSGNYIALNPDTVGSVQIDGDNNTLTTRSAESVTISGDFNIANWDAGAQSAVDSGTGNTIVGP